MSTQDLHHLSIAALAAQIRNRHTSATEVAQHFLPGFYKHPRAHET